MTETNKPSPWSAEGGPPWLNPTTIKGATLATLGLLFLLFPDASTPLLRAGFGIGLVLFGLSDLWSFFRRREQLGRFRLIAAVVAIAAGLGMLFWPYETRRIVELVLALYLIVQGLNLISSVFERRREDFQVLTVVRGLIYGGIGVAMFFAGDFILDTFLVAAAVLAVVFGLIMVGYGTGDRTPEERASLNTAGVLAITRIWLDERDLGPETRDTVADTLYFEDPDQSHKLTSYSVMLLLSVAIATLAILQDSTAVVIGAMLIAPLMTPIMGTAAAIVNGWRGRMLGSLALVGVSVVVAIGVAWAIATWIPALVAPSQNSQIVSRTSPTLLDMAIALAAGAAGAYATVDDRVSSSLPGVAIAVALVPPLGVVGVTLQAGLGDDAGGAFLLFFTNFVSIILASVVVFVLTGLSPVRQFLEQRAKTINVLSTVVVGALIIMVPLGVTGASIINTASSQQTAQRVSDEWIAESPSLDLDTVKASGETVELNVTGTGDLPSVEQLEQDLSDALGRPITVTVEYFETVQITYSDEGGLQTSESPAPQADGG
jgi:uncharacterized hydrophobic protein (TIGR00271 family)